MGITLAFPLAHLPLLVVIAALTACRSVLGRAVLGVVAAIGIYVVAVVSGAVLVAAVTPAPSQQQTQRGPERPA